MDNNNIVLTVVHHAVKKSWNVDEWKKLNDSKKKHNRKTIIMYDNKPLLLLNELFTTTLFGIILTSNALHYMAIDLTGILELKRSLCLQFLNGIPNIGKVAAK